ncbi:MAG: sulfotransferase domain-containing protein [Rhodospirillales bacterium]
MTQILWLASYPKSGNTWLRALLANYLTDAAEPVRINSLPSFAHGDMRSEPYTQLAGRPASSLAWDEINRLRPAVHRHLAGVRTGVVFVKTHSVLGAIDDVPTITPDVTFGAIYVVRNPLDVACSFADHYGLTRTGGVRALCFKGLEIEPKDGHIRQVIADWTTHVESWQGAPGLYLLTVRYEDLLTAPTATFGKVLAFLRIGKDEQRLERAVRHAAFDALAAQESMGGFVERSKSARRFFRRGVAGGWRDELAREDADALIACHRPLMLRLGYLTEAGEVRP